MLFWGVAGFSGLGEEKIDRLWNCLSFSEGWKKLTALQQEDITKTDLSTNQGGFPRKIRVFPQNYVTLALCLLTEG